MKSIIPTTQEIQSILAGQWTQDGVPVKEKLLQGYSDYDDWANDVIAGMGDVSCTRSYERDYYETRAPIQSGEIVFVKEAWDVPYNPNTGYAYKASCRPEALTLFAWHSPVTMPQSAARIFLRCAAVRCERVQEISEADAKANGIASYWSEPHKDVAPFIGRAKEIGADLCLTRREAYQQLWNSRYATKGYPWESNPWVWVRSWERVERS